ncbi:hypothetical protein T492DRAFT_909244 [Pavlovales sp. CCMP2436]|nr:hypothetical protein T492DRAFT_909244 [Pavlovales sp. CCMP2436]
MAGGFTALVTACMYGHPECVRRLLGAGTRTNDVDRDDRTELMRASSQSHAECARLLLEVDAGVVQLLCAYGARRVDLRHPGVMLANVRAWVLATGSWSMPLHHLELLPPARVRQLLAGGADVHASDGRGGGAPTPLALARALLARDPIHTGAALVVAAAAPWSRENHALFPARARPSCCGSDNYSCRWAMRWTSALSSLEYISPDRHANVRDAGARLHVLHGKRAACSCHLANTATLLNVVVNLDNVHNDVHDVEADIVTVRNRETSKQRMAKMRAKWKREAATNVAAPAAAALLSGTSAFSWKQNGEPRKTEHVAEQGKALECALNQVHCRGLLEDRGLAAPEASRLAADIICNVRKTLERVHSSKVGPLSKVGKQYAATIAIAASSFLPAHRAKRSPYKPKISRRAVLPRRHERAAVQSPLTTESTKFKTKTAAESRPR